jgi:hypothetical protein
LLTLSRIAITDRFNPGARFWKTASKVGADVRSPPEAVHQKQHKGEGASPGLRALLDHSVPRGPRTVLAGVEVRRSFELRNGDLLRAAERDRFDVLITSDKNIRHQNRPGGPRIAVLELGTNHWPTLQLHAATVLVALADLGHGEYRRVAFPRPPLVRRPPPERRGPGWPSPL